MFPAHVLVEVSPEGGGVVAVVAAVVAHPLVDVVEVLRHVPRPHRRVLALLASKGNSDLGLGFDNN